MKTALYLLALLLVGCGAAFWFAGALPASNDLTAGTSRKHIETITPQVIRAVGYVEPVSEVRKLTFKMAGVVQNCSAVVGQTVEAGETLATLRNRDEQAAVVVAEKELLVAKAERGRLLAGTHPREIESAERDIARLEERVRHAILRRGRQSRLFETKAGTEEAFDEAKTDFHQAKEELSAAQADLEQLRTCVRDEDRALADAKVELAEASLAAERERLADTILKAPSSGTVLEVFKREGEAVRVFDPQPVLVFADLRELRVRTEVDERYVSRLAVGQAATIYGRGLGDRRVPAHVTSIKTLMGNKTVFTRDAAERKDLDVLQVFVEPDEPLSVPIGLQVDVDVVSAPPASVGQIFRTTFSRY